MRRGKVEAKYKPAESLTETFFTKIRGFRFGFRNERGRGLGFGL
jgi:hypothetical protein